MASIIERALGKTAQQVVFEEPLDTDGVNVIVFDASISEEHTQNSDVTSHPVEVGADITDHIRRLPQELTLTVMVSNHPILFAASLRAEGIDGGDPTERDKDAYRLLLRWQAERRLFRITTSLYTYERMGMTSMSVTRDKDNGNVFMATCRFVEVIQADTDFDKLPKRKKRRQRKKKNGGDKPTNNASNNGAAAAAKKKAGAGSLWKRIFS